MGNSSGGNAGDTTVNWNPSMQPRMDNYLNLVERSLFPKGTEGTNQDLSQFKPYTGQRYAGPSYGEQQAIANSSALTNAAMSPIGSMNAASGQTQDTLNGNYLRGAGADPSANQSNAWNGLNPSVGMNNVGNQVNPWGGVAVTPQGSLSSGGMFSAAPVQAGTNAFQGMDNPYFRQQMQTGLDDITNAYQRGTAADTNKMFAQSGAYGGSAHAQAVANNQMGLARQLGNFSNQALSQQYDRSAALDESQLGRAFQGQQFDANLGSQAFESAAQRGMQGQQFGAGQDLQAQMFNKQIGSQLGENAINRQFDAQNTFNTQNLQNQQNNKQLGWQSSENAINRNQTAYQNERQRQMGAAGLGYGEQGLALDRLNMDMQTGALDRQLGDPYSGRQGQNQLDFGYQQTQDQNNWPFKLMQLLGGNYSSAMGNTSQTTQAYGSGNNVGNILGGLLGAYSMT